ncbi:MAG: hypothetical protein JRI23_13815 [Deltaproteobacteria bacterium]|nr:hypothetical protein [Deltaproteobacteria bacterium]MBW2532806.1 hypothetical protein [Deltaproteobacteria bacterium]
MSEQSSSTDSVDRQGEDGIEPGYVRRLTGRAIVGIIVLGVLVGLAGAYLESHMITVSEWVTSYLGLPGLLLGVTITDTIISPVPPDLFLIVIAKGELAKSWAWVVPLAGLASACGGFAGSFIGRAIGTRWLGARTRRLLEQQRPVIDRYGAWAIVLGALTPVPFSIVCWLSGMAHIRPVQIATVSLLRVPRFVFYYLFIVYADRLGSMLLP